MKNRVILCLIALPILIGVPVLAMAHCDTGTGPVATDARKALRTGKVVSVLKWVKKEHEKEVSSAFEKCMVVRGQSSEAEDLADRYFVETVVRLHRQGEGEPYHGVKQEEKVDPAITAADSALESGNARSLVGMLNRGVEEGVMSRLNRVMQSRRRAEQSVETGREYVEAYVDFVHYVERIHNAGRSGPEHSH